MAIGRIVVIQLRTNQTRSVGALTRAPTLLGVLDVLLEGPLQFLLQAARKRGISDPALDSFKEKRETLTFDALVTQAVNIFQCEMQRVQLGAILGRSVGNYTDWARFNELDDELQAIIPEFPCTKNCLEFVFDFVKDSNVSVGAIGLEVDWIRRQISGNMIPRFDQLVESAGIILGCDGEKQGSLEAILKQAARTPPSGWPTLRLQLQALRDSSATDSTPLASCTSDQSAMTSFPECAFDLTGSSDCTSRLAALYGKPLLKRKLDGLAKWIRNLPDLAQNDLQRSWYSAKRDFEYSILENHILRDPSSPNLMEEIWRGIERLGWDLTPAYKKAVAEYLQQPDTEVPNWNHEGLIYNYQAMRQCMKKGRRFYNNLFDKSDDLSKKVSILGAPDVQQLGQSLMVLKPYVAKLHLWSCVSKVFSDEIRKNGAHPEFTRLATEFCQNRWVEDVHTVLQDFSKWLAKKHESGQSISPECLFDMRALFKKSQLDEDEKDIYSLAQKLHTMGMIFTRQGSRSFVESLRKVRSSESVPSGAGILFKHAYLRKYAESCMARAMKLHYVS